MSSVAVVEDNPTATSMSLMSAVSVTDIGKVSCIDFKLISVMKFQAADRRPFSKQAYIDISSTPVCFSNESRSREKNRYVSTTTLLKLNNCRDLMAPQMA